MKTRQGLEWKHVTMQYFLTSLEIAIHFTETLLEK